MNYPKRDMFFSHRFTRLLMKGCVAQDIGRDATLLLCFIVHQEDAAKYSKPVRFWNEQLMNTMGFKSPKQLVSARTEAIDAGWLHYERTGNRQVGLYFVMIPKAFEGFPDTAIEQNHSVNHSAIHSADGTNKERIAERIGDGLRNELVTESGKHSIPDPNPDPNTTVPAPRRAGFRFPDCWTDRCAEQWELWQITRKKFHTREIDCISWQAVIKERHGWDEQHWYDALVYSTGKEMKHVAHPSDHRRNGKQSREEVPMKKFEFDDKGKLLT
jgi:hypothetical protein